MRSVYLLPRAAKWMRTELPMLETDGFVEHALDPNQQAYQLMKDFIAGSDLFGDDWFPKPLRPDCPKHGIWELRTPDLRFFGWFCRRGVFVISSVDTKAKLMMYNLYEGHRAQAIASRKQLDLDEPKYLDGGPTDVF